MHLTVGSDVGRDVFYAEIWDGEEDWGELIWDEARNKPVLRIFPPKSGEAYAFDLAEVQRVLAEAEDRIRPVSCSDAASP